MNVPEQKPEVWPDKDCWDIATEDFKIAWDYYKINFEERARIYDNFFKTIAVPSSIVATVLIFLPRFVSQVSMSKDDVDKNPAMLDIVHSLVHSPIAGIFSAAVIGVFFLAGFAMFILHCYEEQASKDYMSFINSVRSRLASEYPKTSGYLKLRQSVPFRPKIFGKTASYWRTITMSLINSLLLATSVGIALAAVSEAYDRPLDGSHVVMVVVSYFVALIAHLRIRSHLLAGAS